MCTPTWSLGSANAKRGASAMTIEEYLDDLAIAMIVHERDRYDTGERISIDELICNLGFDPDELRRERDGRN